MKRKLLKHTSGEKKTLYGSLGTIGTEVVLLAAGILLFAAAFPGVFSDDGIAFLGFFALVPMFALIKTASWKSVTFLGFLYGFLSYILFNYWLATFHPLAIYIAPIICSGLTLIMFTALKFIDKAFPNYGFILQGLAFVGYEYTKTMGFAAYTYGIIGYTQNRFLPFIQISEFTGVWGVSLLIALPSAYMGKLLFDWIIGGKPLLKYSFKKHIPSLAVYAVLFAAVLTFGFIRMNQVDNWEVRKDWKVALIQHNADTWLGGFNQYQRNFRSMRRLSQEALKEDPDIIFWSETAFVPGIYWHANYRTDLQMYGLVKEFTEFAKDLEVPLVTGNDDGRLEDPSLPPVLPNGQYNRIDYNAVIHYEDGELKDTYRKMHLVPFTENFPFEEELPRFYQLLVDNDFHFWERGTEPTVFETGDGVKFSTPICFEDVFGYISRMFINNGAEVIVNLTNDSWSRAVSAEMQHYNMSIFRAVENRRGMVRSTNSGITATVDAVGRPIDTLDPFIESYLVSTVPVYQNPPKTFYTKYGDWMGAGLFYLQIIAVAIGIIILFVRWRAQAAQGQIASKSGKSRRKNKKPNK
ncbi:MAG: apolipoprotein N-acyltransferase [Spirochaetia bacterium]|nr:apolipoprotein N-acyltransferase [Spirochaetia bacterium]